MLQKISYKGFSIRRHGGHQLYWVQKHGLVIRRNIDSLVNAKLYIDQLELRHEANH